MTSIQRQMASEEQLILRAMINNGKTCYTFAGGPTMSPAFLKQQLSAKIAASDCSLLNMNSESKECQEMKQQIRSNMRQLLNIPNNYHIWFCGGGAHLQFAGIPMNFIPKDGSATANYTTTGWFSNLACTEAKKFCNPHVVAAMTKDQNGQFVLPEEYSFAPNAAYTHFVDNETVEGLEYPDDRYPYQEGVPLLDDCSSSMLTKPINWEKVSMAYAHAQKNFGISGCLVMIIKDEFLQTTNGANLPSVVDYRAYKQKGDFPFLTNSATIYSIFRMTQHLLDNGGVDSDRFRSRAMKLYDVLDRYPIYLPKVRKGFRSRINVTWDSLTPELGQKCIEEAMVEGLYEFKGHRTMGGFRASLFNLVPDEAVERLVDFLDEFGAKNS